MAEPPVGEWKFRLDAAGAETERLRFELIARDAAAAGAETERLRFELAAARAEIERLRRKVNASLAALAEIAAEPVDS